MNVRMEWKGVLFEGNGSYCIIGGPENEERKMK